MTHDGTSIYVQRAGYYCIYAYSQSNDNSWDTGRFQQMNIVIPNVGNYGGHVTHTPLGGSGSNVWQAVFVGPLGVGQQVYFQVYQQSGYTVNYDAGFWDCIFVPTDSYP